jgi:hypothetical protein
MARELHRGHDVSRLTADLVDGRVSELVHREVRDPGALEAALHQLWTLADDIIRSRSFFGQSRYSAGGR